MGLLSWFSKSAAPDYETLLSRLASDVQDAKIHLSEIRLRERRFGLLVNLYGLGLWALWVGLWWVHGLPFGLVGWEHDGLEAKAVGTGGILAGPVLLVHMYFARQRNVEDAHLRKLLAEQKKQVDAIKKATNYDSTRKLIEQYDMQNGMGPVASAGRPAPSTPQRSQPGTPTPAGKGGRNQVGTPALPGTPRAPGHLLGAGGTPMQPAPGTPLQIPPGMTPEQAAAIHMQQLQSVQPVLPTPEKRWYDRVVDSILGEDPSQASQSKYALVCGECFRHTGLVGSKYEWERMQWICPRCNHMNPPPLSRQNETAASKSGSQPHPSTTTPQTPSTPSALPRQQPAARARRTVGGESATPRSSRLRQEVFTADPGDGQEDDDDDGVMEVDEK